MEIQNSIRAGVALGAGAPSIARAPEPPLMAAVGDRLARLGNILESASGDLSTFRTRMLGAWPSGLGNSATEVSDGQGPALLEQLDALISAAALIREHAEVINGRI